ncbi:putative F-box protein [Trema orientale]|uniref:Putative F-box protein n=1 Tax=Trema orientale TaxID=63057 RepID=A0A2P5BWK4_TREOI|nr:putative F-box protein [Trema orientale]
MLLHSTFLLICFCVIVDWARVQKHILDLILEKLESLVDYLRFNVVCLQWHSVTKENQVERIKASHRRYRYHQVPMLLMPSEDEYTWNIYNVMTNKFLELELLIPYGKRFCGSSKGWLVAVNKDWTVTLYKPYSMINDGNSEDTRIQLPILFPVELESDDDLEQVDIQDYMEEFPNELEDCNQEEPEMAIDPKNVYDYHVYKALITADPLANPNECVVVVIFGDCRELAFIRISQDKTWTKIEPTDRFCSDEVLHHNDLCYVVAHDGALRSFDVTDSCINSTVKYVAPKLPRTRFLSKFSCYIKRYLVEFHGQILQVERYLRDYYKSKTKSRKTKKFRVWRYDPDLKNWIEIKNLGGMALFLGHNTSISVLASNFSGIQPNCIYFTHDIDQIFYSSNPMICDLGMYDIQSRKYKLHFTIDSVALRKMNSRPPIWVVPTF